MTEKEATMPGVTEFECAYETTVRQPAHSAPGYEEFCDAVHRGHEELAAQLGQDEEAHRRACDQMHAVRAAEHLAENLRKALDGDEEARAELGLDILVLATGMSSLGLVITETGDAELDEFGAVYTEETAAWKTDDRKLPISARAARVCQRLGLPWNGDYNDDSAGALDAMRRYERLSGEWHIREFRRAVEALS